MLAENEELIHPQMANCEMPLLHMLSQNFLSQFNDDFSKLKKKNSTLFIIVQHGYKSIATQMEYLISMGIPIDNIYVLLKLKTTPEDERLRQEWIEKYKFKCNLNGNKEHDLEPEVFYDNIIKRTLFDEAHPKYSDIIVCDEGGKLIKKFINDYIAYQEREKKGKNPHTYNVVYVAHTQSDKINNEALDELPFTMIDMANSFVKAKIESHIIARGMLSKIHPLISMVVGGRGQAIAPIKIGIIGIGNIGEAILHQLIRLKNKENWLENHEIEIYTYDLKPHENILQKYHNVGIRITCVNNLVDLLEKLSGKDAFIISSTARDIFTDLQINAILEETAIDNLHLFSASSGDREYPSLINTVKKMDIQLKENKININDIDLGTIIEASISRSHEEPKKIIIYNQGRPINFIPNSHEVEPLRDIQLTRAIKYCAIIFALEVIELVPLFLHYQKMFGINLREKQYLGLCVKYQLYIIKALKELAEENSLSEYLKDWITDLECEEQDIRQHKNGVELPEIHNLILHKLPVLLREKYANRSDNSFFRKYQWFAQTLHNTNKVQTFLVESIKKQNQKNKTGKYYLIVPSRRFLSPAIGLLYDAYHQHNHLAGEYSSVFFLQISESSGRNFYKQDFSQNKLIYLLDNELLKYGKSSYSQQEERQILSSLEEISKSVGNVLLVVSIEDISLNNTPRENNLALDIYNTLLACQVSTLFILTSHFRSENKEELPATDDSNIIDLSSVSAKSTLMACLQHIVKKNQNENMPLNDQRAEQLCDIIASLTWYAHLNESIDFLHVSMKYIFHANYHFLFSPNEEPLRQSKKITTDIVKANFIFLCSLIFSVFYERQVIDLPYDEPMNSLKNAKFIDYATKTAVLDSFDINKIIQCLSLLAVEYCAKERVGLSLGEIRAVFSMIKLSERHGADLVKMFFKNKNGFHHFHDNEILSTLIAYHIALKFLSLDKNEAAFKSFKNHKTSSWQNFLQNFIEIFAVGNKHESYLQKKLENELIQYIAKKIFDNDFPNFFRTLFRLLYEKDPQAGKLLLSLIATQQNGSDYLLQYFQLTMICLSDIVSYIEKENFEQFKTNFEEYARFFYYCLNNNFYEALELITQPLCENPGFFVLLCEKGYIAKNLLPSHLENQNDLVDNEAAIHSTAVLKKLPWFLFPIPSICSDNNSKENIPKIMRRQEKIPFFLNRDEKIIESFLFNFPGTIGTKVKL